MNLTANGCAWTVKLLMGRLSFISAISDGQINPVFHFLFFRHLSIPSPHPHPTLQSTACLPESQKAHAPSSQSDREWPINNQRCSPQTCYFEPPNHFHQTVLRRLRLRGQHSNRTHTPFFPPRVHCIDQGHRSAWKDLRHHLTLVCVAGNTSAVDSFKTGRLCGGAPGRSVEGVIWLKSDVCLSGNVFLKEWHHRVTSGH